MKQSLLQQETELVTTRNCEREDVNQHFYEDMLNHQTLKTLRACVYGNIPYRRCGLM